MFSREREREKHLHIGVAVFISLPYRIYNTESRAKLDEWSRSLFNILTIYLYLFFQRLRHSSINVRGSAF